ncbi:hypothetical protein Clacol_006138 [Clathrus columnatus]|uniref:F-box domain-containing protein n=1 Tax=Clathrus columnatus TaxID=1419009 RepID=A0AAV5AG73_9AGAM|nr:hypothetical protein Clacol_006138 [Clathrus columnatus]
MAAERTPIEIWHQIIREATRIPSWALDGTLYDPLEPKGSLKHIRPDQTHLLFPRLLSIKTSISLVCKSWRHLCSEFLYEFLVIHHDETIIHLLNKFQTIDMNIHKVFRIDFFPSLFDINRAGHFPSASTLISLCPSLLAVAFHAHICMWNTSKDPVFEVIAKTPSIRCFEWHALRQGLPKALVSFLESNSSQTWSFLINYASPEYKYHELGNARLPEPRVAPMDDEGILLFSQDPPPRVTRHMIFGNSIDMSFLHYPNEAIHNMSMSIITLHPCTLEDSTDFLSSLPPTVDTLIIYIKDILVSSPSIAYHVKRVGLKLDWEQSTGTAMPSPPEIDYCFNILVGYDTPHLYFPSLQRLQLNDPELATTMRARPHQLRLWEHRCSSRGILLCDEFGNRFKTGSYYPGVSNSQSKVRKTSKDPNLKNKHY